MKPPNTTPPPSTQPAQVADHQLAPGTIITQAQIPSSNQTTTLHAQIATPHQTITTAAPTSTVQQQQQQSQPQQQAQQSTPPTTTLKDLNHLTHASLNPQPIITTQAIVVLKPTNIGAHQEQQAPLALTTQPQNKATSHPTSTLQIQKQQPAITAVASSNTISVQQPHQLTQTTKDTNNLDRTNPISQALITTQANIVTKTTTINSPQEQQAPLALITQPQVKTPTQVSSSPTPHIQQQQQQQQQLPQVSVTTAAANIKNQPNRFICCLLDNGVKCDRVAGNASFSARIQKIVASKKMNFVLDKEIRHSYICDHHKAVITVAKKSVSNARESKAAARNLVAANAAAAASNTNVNALPAQHINNYNDMPMNQTAIQHPVNLDLMTAQGRLANNHTGMLLSMPIRPGAQIAYGHFGAGAHPNQVNRMDHNIAAAGNLDNTGGDNVPSSSGGVEVDLQQLQVNTLRRYKRHFRVQTRPGLNKMQLAESLKHHFRSLPIIEKEAITYFVYIVKSSRNKLDHNPKADQ